MNKIVIAIVAALIALPVAAQQLSPGHVTLARSLGLDPNEFTLSELSEIEALPTNAQRADRIHYMRTQKALRRPTQSFIPAPPREKPSRFLSQRQGIGRNDY
jgi:hypothetical protein